MIYETVSTRGDTFLAMNALSCGRSSLQEVQPPLQPRKLRLPLLFLSLLAVWVDSASSSTGMRSTTIAHGGDDQPAISLVPNIGHLGPLQTLALWQLPPGGQPKKLLIIFEARENYPYGFWDYSTACPLCTGKPECRKIVLDALAMNYAVLVPSSTIEGGDWEAWPPENNDLQNAVQAVSQWKSMLNLENVPAVALGCSAGGHVLSTIALYPDTFESIAIMISKGNENAWVASTPNYPPTLFVHMPKDSGTQESVSNTRILLDSKNIPNAEARWYEQRVTPDWFTQLIPGMDISTSSSIVQALISDGFLTDENSTLSSDGYYNDWDARVRRWNVLPLDPAKSGKLLFEDAVFDELGVAWALHITISRRNTELFAWFEGGYGRLAGKSVI